ncbi:hypothetical protein [Bradyrhizobium sp. MOS002]|uniref:hypothetical protein n=1 Tax=Bradyrhizobium sp. MOS002 TaxID=2133947 RepID=UPI0011B29BCC|nr:hypothetical protein [Bradyrhizobium sp. MOS002]
METDHQPRNNQAKPSLWFAEPTGDSLSLLENALREDEPSLRDHEHTEDVGSLREENARLRGLLILLSNLICQNVVRER